ncbi:MAG: tetratricopeptide repeat protein [Phycisphaerae bacterium]|nr:tetratricopeptide repeat protein [Phycisphaerae bacterium]
MKDDDWQDAESRVEKAHDLFERGKIEAALKELRAAIRVNPYNHLWHYDMGMMLDQLGRYDEAAAAFRHSLDISHDDIESLNALGIDLTRTGAPQAALACFERCQKLDPNYEPCFCNRIMAYTDLGDHDKAEEMFYMARQLSDECPFCSFNLGESLYRRGLFAKAIDCWKHVARIDPDHGDVHYRIGGAYWAMGNLRTARRCFREQLRRDPGHTDALLDLGRLSLEANRPERAREKFRHAVELDPGNSYAWSLMGEAELRLGRDQQAQVALNRSLRLDREQAWVRLGLAQIAIDAAQADKAAALIADELALKHDLLDVLEIAGQLAVEIPRFDLAHQAFSAMLGFEPKDVRANEGLAVALAGLGRVDDSIAQCRHTLALDEKSVPSLYQLAENLLAQGHGDDAIALVDQADAIEPNNELLVTLRKRIELARMPRPLRAVHSLLTWQWQKKR